MPERKRFFLLMSSLTQGGKKVFGVTRTELWVITQKLKMLLDWTPLHILMKREGGFLGSAKEDQILFLVTMNYKPSIWKPFHSNSGRRATICSHHPSDWQLPPLNTSTAVQQLLDNKANSSTCPAGSNRIFLFQCGQKTHQIRETTFFGKETPGQSFGLVCGF